MPGFVLDPSVALSWFFEDEQTDMSRAVHGMVDTHTIIVPPHWFAEVANGIRMGERRGRCDPDDVPAFTAMLDELDFAIDTLAPFAQFDLVLPLAREHGLTVYDAAYLHCAASNRIPLAAFDKKLARAARDTGIEVIGDVA